MATAVTTAVVLMPALTCASISRSVGKSKMRVSGNSATSPSRAVSRFRNSTAPSESSPASISGTSAETFVSSSAAISRTATVVVIPASLRAGGLEDRNAACVLRLLPNFASNALADAAFIATGEATDSRMAGDAGARGMYSIRNRSWYSYILPAA